MLKFGRWGTNVWEGKALRRSSVAGWASETDASPEGVMKCE